MLLTNRSLVQTFLLLTIISFTFNNVALCLPLTNTPTENTTVQGIPSVCADGSTIYLKPKTLTSNPNKLDLRKHFRFETGEIAHPIKIEVNNTKITLANLSREGIGLTHNNTIKTNDIIPIKIRYKDIEINTQAQIVFATDTKAGGKLLPQDEKERNELLYLSVLLEYDNNMITRRIYN